MFKTPDTKSPINIKNFGVGSYFVGASHEVFLVVPTYSENTAALLELSNMKLHPKTYIKDVNHLTEDEARELLSLTKTNNTFSDMSLNAQGFKIFVGKY